jgi:hypothetical protein
MSKLAEINEIASRSIGLCYVSKKKALLRIMELVGYPVCLNTAIILNIAQKAYHTYICSSEIDTELKKIIKLAVA